ncbi:hypothetical protein HWV62_33242 [Athelia sp. TMB]|nr:hypothetical protein HWV62_33242 [Athelia sp. TMB]
MLICSAGLRATLPSSYIINDSDMNKPVSSLTATRMSQTRNREPQLQGAQLGQATINGSIAERFDNIWRGPCARTTRCISEEQELPRKTLRIQTGTMELEGQCLNEHANMRARITVCRPTRSARRALLPETQRWTTAFPIDFAESRTSPPSSLTQTRTRMAATCSDRD